jgi:ABC-type branched-subunit amino acid transport system substrate-binding protein
MPRFRYSLVSALALGLLVGACSHVAPAPEPAKPVSPPIVAPAPPPPKISQVPLPPVSAPIPSPAPLAKSGPATVALLVPLSGASAQLGAALFNAAQLALFEMADNNFNLLPFDSKGTAEGAVAAVQQALSQHADIIIGPLFSIEAKAAAPLARQAGVSMVSFTTDRTAAGNGVYALGFLPEQQALRIVDYARSVNRTRLAILAPSTDYGRIVVEYLSNNAPPLGITISGLQYYDPNAVDIGQTIRHLVKNDSKRPGDIGFDALILPDEGQRLRNIAAQLPSQGIDPTQIKLLGTMLWEDSRPGGEPALIGGWYAAPPDASHVDFDNRYAKAFGGHPPRLASLAYDATSLAAVLARRNPRDFSATMLSNPLGFAGVDGLFRLRPDGTAERGYAIREVQPDGPDKEIAPAPASFQASY